MISANQTSASYLLSVHGYPSNGVFSFLPEIQTLEILLAVAVFVSIHSLRQRKHQGLPVWPVIGMFPSLLVALRSGVYDWVTAVVGRRGCSFIFRGPWLTNLEYCLVTADPRNLEHILKTKFSNFPKGDYFHYVMQDFLGTGIFSADEEIWRQQRKATSLEFHTAAFRALTAESLVELVHSRLLPVLDSAADGAAAVDLQDVLLRLTFDNVCMIAFGTDPGCLRLGLPDIPFARAFEEATEATLVRFLMPTAIWEALRFFNIGTERWLKRSIKEVDRFAYEVIRTRKNELQLATAGDEKKKGARSDLLTSFMKLEDENGQKFSEKYLRDVCVNIILAGRDTSSVALAWFFWLLNKYPEAEKRIMEEITKIEEERGGDDGCDEFVFQPREVKKMEYLQAALSEALRLYPSVPNDLKQVVEDDVLPDGTKLKRGSRVIYAIYSMGRMESIWGPDCREFKPERWLRDCRFIGESAYKFTAFNGGPRLCLGKDFAYYQMKFVAASVLRRYHVHVVPGHPVVPKLALTMYMKHGLKVTISKRKG